MITTKTFWYYASASILAALILFSSCKKDDDSPVIPTLSTTAITEITQSTAISGGNITKAGGAKITARGVCWSTNQTPTITDSKTADGTGEGSFTSSISGLEPNTTYYVRAYATNSAGTGYGTALSFTTVDNRSIPVLSTTAITEITQSAAISGGNITNAGEADVTARGVCWSTNQTPTVADSKTTDGTGDGIFTSSISGLEPNTTYYVRAYATNSVGTGYGTALSFTTAKAIAAPVLSTTAVTEITQSTATSGGNITDAGNATITARGVCWSTNQTPTIADSKTADGTGEGSFTSSISGLEPNTTYYVRAYATNSAGTSYGDALSFTTAKIITIPVLSTVEITGISQSGATSGGNITDAEGVTARGVCWSTNQTPTIADSKTEDGTGEGSFTSTISGLQSNTTYYVRAYATNSAGTGYGEALSFTTLEVVTGGVVDVDGNIYKTVTIGTQEWFAENLRTTKYNNGTSIPTGQTNAQWAALTTGAYTIFPASKFDDGPTSDAEVFNAYGALYNYYAVVSPENLCPTGWRVPTKDDWSTLIEYVGGEGVAGTKLKSSHTQPDAHPRWNTGAIVATDDYGFSAFPGGARYSNGGAGGAGKSGNWWSSIDSPDGPFGVDMYYTSDNASISAFNRGAALSVRCVKNN